mgnify:CR=1 FL=1
MQDDYNKEFMKLLFSLTEEEKQSIIDEMKIILSNPSSHLE